MEWIYDFIWVRMDGWMNEMDGWTWVKTDGQMRAIDGLIWERTDRLNRIDGYWWVEQKDG